MARRLYECVVCGRKFPEGQGIVIVKAGRALHFHSKACAAKFFKLLLERVDDKCITPAIDEVLAELRRALEERRRRARKVI